MNNTQAYMWESVRKVINLDEHIDFLNQLINKYSWSAEQEKKLRRHLKLINDKQNDDCVNLSVIGEFSCGKSSFINAILHEDLLVSSALQGTTLVNSIIEYSPKYSLRMVYKNGKVYKLKSNDKEMVRQKVSKLTTDGSQARDISHIVIGVPSACLRDYKVRIIDTPGTNSVDSWHEATTRRALKEYADMSVVLTSAIGVLPQTLLEFMQENLADVLSQCAVAVTRADCVPPKELGQVMEYVNKKLAYELDIDDVFAVPIASPAILANINGTRVMDQQEKWAEISEESIRKLFRRTAQTRQVAQIKKLLSLVNDVFSFLDVEINEKKNALNDRFNLLQRSRQAPLAPFVAQQKARLTAHFAQKNKDLRGYLADSMYRAKDAAIASLKDNIRKNPAKVTDALKKYLETTFIDECKTKAMEVARISENMSRRQNDIFNECINAFRKAFMEQFKRLGILEVMFSPRQTAPLVPVNITMKDIEEAINYVTKEMNSEDRVGKVGFWGSVIAGAAVAGPLGAVGGAVVGFFIGGAALKDINKVKSQTIEKVDKPLNILFDEVISNTLGIYNLRANDFSKAISSECDHYLRQYRREVDNRIAQHQQQLQALQNEISSTTSDLQLISTHRQQLQHAKKMFNQ